MSRQLTQKFTEFFEAYDEGEYLLDEQAALVRCHRLLTEAKPSLAPGRWATLSQELAQGRQTKNAAKKRACVESFRTQILPLVSEAGGDPRGQA